MPRPSLPRIVVAASLAVAASIGPPIPLATAGAVRVIDGDGIVHWTNVPGDPRYRGLPGSTGTAAGWLRLPARARRDHAADIQEISRRFGVSPTLVRAIVRAESGFDPGAVSAKGAGGLMQLMPQTASALGVADRFDPRENITGGVRHLRYLLDRYRGSVPLALAAYNAGEGPVDAHRGVPPYPETQQYVRRVMREAGLTDAGAAPSVLYRFVGADDTVTYSNIRPTSKDARLLPRRAP
ncbi:MAG TPA: lytic transglycosylase domain-containing protein [Methylomirabilota bacterium]|jgi:soluble lytic murein transglycosylase